MTAAVDPRQLEELWRYEGLRVGSLRAMRSLLECHHAEMIRLARVHVTPAEAPEVVRRALRTAVGGLAMFAWSTSFRSWLLGIVLAEARAHHRATAAAPLHGRVLAERPDAATVVTEPGQLPWSGWWTADSWRRLSTWLDGRPAVERETVVLRDVLGWPASEVRDVLGWTDATAEELHAELHRDLAAQLAAEMGRAVPFQDLTPLLHQLPTAAIDPPGHELVEDFRRWRSARGLTLSRRVVQQLRRHRRLPARHGLLPVT